MQKIIIIEDDIDISDMLKMVLEEENYEVVIANDGKEGIEAFDKSHFDLVLLDLMIPKRNGMEVLQEIRKQSDVPIIIVSAKSEDFDKSVLLGAGADDYITKPFSFVELIARVKAALRRANLYEKKSEKAEKPIVSYKNLTLDKYNHIVKKNGEELKLTSTEFELLALFMENPNRVFTKSNLYQSVWKDDYLGDENIVNVHMSRLRSKIEDDSKQPQYIQTLWGIGYRLEKEDD